MKLVLIISLLVNWLLDIFEYLLCDRCNLRFWGIIGEWEKYIFCFKGGCSLMWRVLLIFK